MILLVPEVLNNLAASFVLEARRSLRGLGSLEEAKLLAGGYPFPEVRGLAEEDAKTLLDSVALLFLEHNLCFRETASNGTALLIFPSLISTKKASGDGPPFQETNTYVVTGAAENIYAALVVLLGYTNLFARTDQWQNQAQYQVGEGEVCGFRMAAERDGEIELVLYYAPNVSSSVRELFQNLFELFLRIRRLNFISYPPVCCTKCFYEQKREEVIKRIRQGEKQIFCSNCGQENRLGGATAAASTPVANEAEAEVARLRTQFAMSLTLIKSLALERSLAPKDCFICYAWGNSEHKRWTIRLAQELREAGIAVHFDQWHNVPGDSIVRHVELVSSSHFVLVIGTPRLVEKYLAADTASVVAHELRLIGARLNKDMRQRSRVIPLLLDGEQATALPPMLQDSVFFDFREEQNYLFELRNLVIRLYELPFDDPAVIGLCGQMSPPLSPRHATNRP